MSKNTKNKRNKIADEFDIESNIIECNISYRGGTLKVNVSEIFPNVSEPIMGAYQNYLGGGIAGAVVGGAMFSPDELNEKERKVFEVLNERIKKFFYNVNAGGGDDYMVENVNSYKRNQNLPVSGY